jgi:hypothetical protein
MTRRTVMIGVALLGVPLAFALFSYVAYSLALSAGNLPFAGDRQWRWWVALAASVIAGAALLLRSLPGPSARRALVVAAYAAAMTLLLSAVHLGVACSRGDCL